MDNLIIGIGNCGANIIKDITDNVNLLDWQIVYFDGLGINFESKFSHYENIYIFCGLGGQSTFQHTSEIISKCRPLATNLLCFCTLPFRIEGEMHYQRAESTLSKIYDYADIIVVQPNDKLPSDYNITMMNKPIVASAIASIEQSNKPLLYALSAIIDSTGINTGLKNFISSSHLDIYVNETRRKNLVSEALRSNGSISAPDGVKSKMQQLWADYHSGKPMLNQIFEVQLPRIGIDK